MKTTPDSFDPEALDQALAQLIDHATAARDSFLMGDDREGRAAFELAITDLSRAVRQISLKNRK